MKKFLAGIVAMLVLAFAVIEPTQWAAPALPAGWVQIPKAHVAKQLKVVAKLSRYDMPVWTRPTAYVVPDEDFIALACGLWGLMTRQCSTVGIFFPADPDTVYIRQHPEISADVQDEILVHELTHWMQKFWGFNENFASCPNTVAHEVEAYSVAYLYAVLEQKRDVGFRTPDLTCGYGEGKPTAGVVGEPKITRYDHR